MKDVIDDVTEEMHSVGINNLYVDSLNLNIKYDKNVKAVLQRIWLHHRELSIELSNIKSLLKVIERNPELRSYVESELLNVIRDANIHIKILKKNYKNFKIDTLPEIISKETIDDYISYNELLSSKVLYLISKNN
ncbi:MAG: hypothetical protein KatS3mg002_0781 [Candidatus Woesearchaeota archaeon]|nr:MAG: hypothetical protein KatS3mg002_0781 [Candidatus Woesearchaeota archaeon]